MTILYMCRYAPAEILAAMGATTEYIEPECADLSRADAALHPNMCSFSKAAFAEISRRLEGGGADGVLFTSCCDSTRRLCDAVKRRFPGKFVYMHELPVKQDAEALALYRSALMRMIGAYAAFSGQAFDAARLEGIMRESPTPCHEGGGEAPADGVGGAAGGEVPAENFGNTPQTNTPFRMSAAPHAPRIGLLGAKAPPALRAAIETAGGQVVFDATCAGQKNRFYMPSFALGGGAGGGGSCDPFANAAHAETPSSALGGGAIDAYVRAVFSKFPCMRMACGDMRAEGLPGIIASARAEGIVYHTVKFCDNYAYEYAGICATARAPVIPDPSPRKGTPPNPRHSVGNPAARTLRPESPLGIPLLKIETEYANAGGGGLSTRLEAFVEQLRGARAQALAQSTPAPRARYFIGVDSGSTSTDAVVIERGADGAVRIAASAMLPTGARAAESAAAARKEALARAGIGEQDICGSVTTGYGRALASLAGADAMPNRRGQGTGGAGIMPNKRGQGTPGADCGVGTPAHPAPSATVTEITCHARGAAFLFPEARSVIDIGGQDSKAMRLEDSASNASAKAGDGKAHAAAGAKAGDSQAHGAASLTQSGGVAGFAMNDKCAAGTGRFLEMAAKSLGVPIGAIGDAALASTETLRISSMCTVFAESEVVSLVAAGKRTEDILWALCRAIAARNEALIARAGAAPPYVMTGGVAKNKGVVRAFEELLGTRMLIPEEPETVGALGAALIASERG